MDALSGREFEAISVVRHPVRAGPGSRRMQAWEWVQRGIAAALLLPALAIALAVGLLIRLGSRGPILIRHTREGRNGVCFAMYKLRTMVVDGEARIEEIISRDEALREEWRTYGRLARDPRVAGRVARFARRFSIDELPQILNVVLGQMRLVGPRPLPAWVVAGMSPEERRLRQATVPGMTGLWQVSGRSDLKLSDIGPLDRIYLRDPTVLNDLAILLRTPGVVLSGKGAY